MVPKKIDIIINNRIRFKSDWLPKQILIPIKKSFSYANPDYYKAKSLGFWPGKFNPTIDVYRIDDNEVSIPIGGLNILGRIFSDNDIEYVLHDERHIGESVEFQFDEDFILRDYQVEASYKILENQNCLIQGAPGSGKTEIILAAINKVGLKTGVVVHTKLLLDQWIDRVHERFGISINEIGCIGGGKFKIGDEITIMMQQTARNRIDKLWNQFGFLCLDECHHAPAKTFYQLIDSFDSKYRVGVSATMERRDLKHFLSHQLFGEIAYSIVRNDLEDLGYLTPIDLHIVPTDFWFDLFNEEEIRDYLFNEYFMNKNEFDELSIDDKMKYEKQLELPRRGYPEYLTAVASDKDRNNLIYKYVKEKYDDGKRIIIFTKRRKHCELWRDTLAKIGIEVVILWGGDSDLVNQNLERLKNGDIRIGIGTVLDEAIDMPAVDVGFITYRNAKNRGQIEQQAGRLARLFKGKSRAELYYFHDHKISLFKNDVNLLKKQFKKVILHARKGKK